MNGKKAKHLRRKAEGLMCEFIKDRVLTPELTEGKDCGSLLVALPERAYYWKGFTRYLGVGSKGWFRKQVKKNPTVTYDDLMQRMYGTN